MPQDPVVSERRCSDCDVNDERCIDILFPTFWQANSFLFTISLSNAAIKKNIVMTSLSITVERDKYYN